MLRYLDVVVVSFMMRIALASITPKVNLTSCLQEMVTLYISDTWDGGLVYLRTDRAYNILPTSGGPMLYTCTFQACNIKWDSKFTLCVQERVHVQREHDLFLWFACIMDTDILSPVMFDSSAGESGNVTTVSYKPEGAIKLTLDGVPLMSGDSVKLGTLVDVLINITNNYADFFDISVKSCDASMIPLYTDQCPVEEELFGPFVKTGIGTVTNSFRMFRPTTTGSSYDVIFSCILAVCLGPCDETTICNSTSSNTTTGSRRKREVDSEGTRGDSMFVGTMIKVVDELEPEVPVIPDENLFCLHIMELVLICICYPVVLAVPTRFSMIFYRRRRQNIDGSQSRESQSKSEPTPSVHLNIQERIKTTESSKQTVNVEENTAKDNEVESHPKKCHDKSKAKKHVLRSSKNIRGLLLSIGKTYKAKPQIGARPAEERWSTELGSPTDQRSLAYTRLSQMSPSSWSPSPDGILNPGFFPDSRSTAIGQLGSGADQTLDGKNVLSRSRSNSAKSTAC